MNLNDLVSGNDNPTPELRAARINNVYVGMAATGTSPSGIVVSGMVDYAYVADQNIWVTIRISDGSVRRVEARKVTEVTD